VNLFLGNGISGQDCSTVNCISVVSCVNPGSGDDPETDDIIGKITGCVDCRYQIDGQGEVGTLAERDTIPGENFTYTVYNFILSI